MSEASQEEGSVCVCYRNDFSFNQGKDGEKTYSKTDIGKERLPNVPIKKNLDSMDHDT